MAHQQQQAHKKTASWRVSNNKHTKNSELARQQQQTHKKQRVGASATTSTQKNSELARQQQQTTKNTNNTEKTEFAKKMGLVWLRLSEVDSERSVNERSISQNSPIFSQIGGVGGDLNPRPLACHASALPTELQPH